MDSYDGTCIACKSFSGHGWGYKLRFGKSNNVVSVLLVEILVLFKFNCVLKNQ